MSRTSYPRNRWFPHAETRFLCDNVAFLKRNIDNVTADPGRYRHQLDRCGSAGELIPVGHVLLLRFADRDFRSG